MKLLVIGVNHKTAPIALREQLAFSDEQITESLQELVQYTEGAVIVSTCNRTEIYALATTSPNKFDATEIDVFDSTIKDIRQWLATNKNLPISQLESHLYIHKNSQAINHWIRVASGLDSMVLGEPQILGQIKSAVHKAMACNSVTPPLHWTINQVFSATKRVRHETQIGAQAVTLGFATAKLATQIFEHVNNCRLLIVASGAMNRLVAKHVLGLGIAQVVICNRSIDNAKKLAIELQEINPLCQIDVQPLTGLEKSLEQADIVCCSSGSMHPLISFAVMKKIIKKRRYSPMLMVDLAVPRDIEQKVGKLDEIYLYSIDDLQHVIAGNIDKRKQAAVDAELLISQLVVNIDKNFRIRTVGSDIQQYREIAHARAESILAEMLQQLPKRELQSPKLSNNTEEHDNVSNSTCNHNVNEEIEVLMTELTRRLTQTLTHAPSKLMREVASEGEDRALETVVSTLVDAYRE